MLLKNIIKVAHYYEIKYKFASSDDFESSEEIQSDDDESQEYGLSASDQVREILDNSDKEYLLKTLETRNPGSNIQAGSVFSSPQTVKSLKSAHWTRYNHPDIASIALGFKAKIPGKLGIVELSKLPPDMPVKFQTSHGGAIEGVAEVVADYPESAAEVKHTTLIAGPDNDKFVMWTFFPGDPTPRPQPIPISPLLEKYPDGIATVKDAINEGFIFVKKMSF